MPSHDYQHDNHHQILIIVDPLEPIKPKPPLALNPSSIPLLSKSQRNCIFSINTTTLRWQQEQTNNMIYKKGAIPTEPTKHCDVQLDYCQSIFLRYINNGEGEGDGDANGHN